MASTRKLQSDKLTRRVAASLPGLLPDGSTILVGLSGGVDSVVLLHLLHHLAPDHAWQLSALHVHHGISQNADHWAEFCAGLCVKLSIPLHTEYVDINPLREHGIEAAARQLRLRAFAAQSCDFVALAHHADDQAETLLLQLLRGAGVRGSSAMPELSAVKGGLRIVRPMLNATRQELLAYADSHELAWIEDESNADDSYPRNFLRHRLLPVMAEKFPAYRETLGRSAQHFAEAAELLDELAQIDGAGAILDNTLRVAALQAVSVARAKNLLRYFLYQLGCPMPQTAQLEDMLHQLLSAKADAAVCINFAAGLWQVRRYQGLVHVLRALPDFDRHQILPWQGGGQLVWPALNTVFALSDVTGQGISRAKLQAAPLSWRYRQGGEALRPFANSPSRTLKNLLQEHQVPPWLRDRLPLLYCGEALVCVPSVAIAAEFSANTGEAGVVMVVLNASGNS
jgi:tRNA(Ile)-lysidine synthase